MRFQADGAIAQLGERRVCNAKVVGSIPTGSTRPGPARSNYSITACHESCVNLPFKGDRMTHGMRVMRLVCVL